MVCMYMHWCIRLLFNAATFSIVLVSSTPKVFQDMVPPMWLKGLDMVLTVWV